MVKHNLLAEKSYAFSVRIIKLFIYLKKHGIERSLIVQLLRSGTSIGANIEEAIGAQSKNDFIHKMNIGYKECRESLYWPRLLKDTGIIPEKLANSFIRDAFELNKIIASILISSKKSGTGAGF